MTRTREALLAAAAVAAGVGAARLAAARDFEPYQTAGWPLALLVGWSFVGCGLVTWRQRPRNRLGWLMVFTGFAWFATFLTDAHTPWLFTLGTAVQSIYLVAFAFIVLSFPSGRLQGRVDRVLIAAAVVLVTVVEVVALLFSDSQAALCSQCPANTFELSRNDGVANGILQGQRVGGASLALLAVALLVRRWRVASAPQRRDVAPVLWAGSATIAVLAVSIANDVFGDPLGEAPKWALAAVFASVPIAVVVVLVRRRLARGSVAGLVVELGDRAQGWGLRDALARALGDPSLELAYWFAAGDRYVDDDGRTVELPTSSARTTTVVERHGRPVAALLHDPALGENLELVESVCAAAALTLENERLRAELRARLAELRASRARLVEAGAAERRRIERDLHDGAQQRLISIAMSLGLVEARLPEDPLSAAPIVREAREALGVALAELRELSHGIFPSMLSERGLAAALEELAGSAALPVALDVRLPRHLPAVVEAAAYFVVSEALANAGKHAHASDVRVAASAVDGTLLLAVSDDGIGGAGGGSGTGLRGLADRVEALGGSFTIASPPGRGTTLTAEIPCA